MICHSAKKTYFASASGWVSCQASIVDASLATGGLGGARRGGGQMRVASIHSEAFESRWIGWEIGGNKIHGTTSRFGNQ